MTLAALLVPSRARAFCRTTTLPEFAEIPGCPSGGAPLFWRNACVGISYQKAEGGKLKTQELATRLNEAFATWTGVTCAGGGHPSIAVKQLASTAATTAAYRSDAPNANLVIMRDESWDHPSRGAPDLMKPTITFNANTGEILDVDLQFNTKDHDFTLSDPVPSDGSDLQTVLLRTAGRFLGLTRSDDTASVMYGDGYLPGMVRRSLSPDDIAGICEIYPPDGTRKVLDGRSIVADPCDPTPRNGLDEGGSTAASSEGCAVGPNTASTGTLVVAALTALALAGARRRPSSRPRRRAHEGS